MGCGTIDRSEGMILCRLGFHSWVYYTQRVVYKKDELVINERDEVYKRKCVHCGLVEKPVGKFERWLRVNDEPDCRRKD